MGPVQVKPPSGRGDKFEAVDFMWAKIQKADQMAILRARFEKLDEEAKEELQEIFDDEDPDNLSKDSLAP